MTNKDIGYRTILCAKCGQWPVLEFDLGKGLFKLKCPNCADVFVFGNSIEDAVDTWKFTMKAYDRSKGE